MPDMFTQNHLEDLLKNPREDLSFEIKNWLDLANSKEDKAILAKAILAIANHGGGVIALGLTEIATGVIEAEGKPVTFDAYSQDVINGIVKQYAEPDFHCEVHFVSNESGNVFPMIGVPGGHRAPIRARRASPAGKTVLDNAIYIRKPGPKSEAPTKAHEWDHLLERCLRNRRDDMFSQIRDLINGAVPQTEEDQSEDPQFLKWYEESMARWTHLTEPLPKDSGPAFQHGFYSFTYEILGDTKNLSSSEFQEALKFNERRYTGWSVWWYPTRQGIAPYSMDGATECWIGGDSETDITNRDPAHSDFWRLHPEGRAFLIRGYSEDSIDLTRTNHPSAQHGDLFDLTLPIWRTAEAVLHAGRLAEKLFDTPKSVRFSATFTGLENRILATLNPGRSPMSYNKIAKQPEITLETHIDIKSIDGNLPEIVHPFLSPLYALFDFYELPISIVNREIEKLREGRF